MMVKSSSNWGFSSIHFRLKKTEAKKVFRSEQVREYALFALNEIEKLSRKVIEKQTLYFSGNSHYKQSILKDLDLIQSNLINPSSFPKVLDVSELSALEAFFSPIASICEEIKSALQERKVSHCQRHCLWEEQKNLNALDVFDMFLEKIKERVASRNPKPNGVYFAYAWPSEEKSEKEYWIQEFLVLLKKHLEVAGVHTVRLDVESNRYGGNIYQYMQQAEHDDYVLLFGTESLKEKHDLGLSNVCVEIIHILRKREEDKQKGLTRVFPILLSGDQRTAFPVEYERYITIKDWTQKGYLDCFEELYLELFNLDPARYLSVIREEWDQCFESKSEAQVAFQKYQAVQDVVTPPQRSKEMYRSSSGTVFSSRKNILKWGLTILVALVFSFTVFSFNKLVFNKSVININKIYIKNTYPNFIRSTQYIDYLKEKCITEKKEGISKVALWGEAGVGKSEIAVAFANKHLNDFSLIHWISCETQNSIDKSYQSLAREIGIFFEEGESPKAIESRVLQFLEQKASALPWLLIYDNPAEMMDLPQRGNGVVLVTSRSQLPWRTFDCIEVQSFTQEEALELFKRLLGPGHETERLAIIEELDYFPLTIDQAVCYISEVPGMTEKKFLALLKQKKTFLIEHVSSNSHYPRSMVAAWETTLEHLHLIHPEAIEWFHFASNLYPEKVPYDWIKKWLKEIKGETDPFQIELKASDILRVLLGYSLIRFDETSQTFSLKRLIQEFELENQTRWKNTREEVLSFLLMSVEDLSHIREVESRTDLWEELRYWEICAERFLNFYAKEMESREIGILNNALGNWKRVSGDFPLAKKLHEDTLQLRIRLLGPEHLDVAISLLNLGWVLDDLGEYEKSRQCYEKALLIRKKQLGEGHPLVADSMGKLGWAMYRLNDYQAAYTLHQKSLEIRMKLLGEFHQDVAVAMKNIGLVLEKQGKYEKAKHFFERALRIQKNCFGEEHPHVAEIQHYLGELLVIQGRYHEASQLFDQGLKILETYHGIHHPDVGRLLSSKVVLLVKRGYYQKAKALCQEVLETKRSFFGDRHILVATPLSNLAYVFFEQGNYVKAKALCEEVLAIRTNFLGEKHLLAAESMENLGEVSKATGQYAEAKALFEKALTIKEEFYRKDHPSIACSLSYLGETLEKLGDYEKAKKLHERALQMRKDFFGERHPEVAKSLHDLGLLFVREGKYFESEQSYLRALDIRKEFFGEKHPLVGVTANDLAIVLMRLGRFEESEQLHQSNLKMQKEILGKEHPNIATTMNYLALVLKRQGQFSQSQTYYEKALAMRRRIFGKRHPDVASSMNYLANLFETQGKYFKALDFYRAAYEMDEQLLGKDHPRVVYIENDFAKALANLGYYSEARERLEHVFEVRTKLLGVNHPETAHAISTLGWIKHAIGEYKESERLYLQAIDILQKNYGETHLNLAYSYFYLAWVLEDQGQFDEAIKILNQALEIGKVTLGEDHPYLGYLYHRLGCIYTKLGKIEEGKALILEALRLHKKKFGKDHPHLMYIYDRLGWIYGKEGNYERARKVLLMALEKGNKIFGEEHPRQAMTLQHLGEVVEMQGKPQEAALAYQKAYQIRKKFLGEEHPAAVESQESLQRVKT